MRAMAMAAAFALATPGCGGRQRAAGPPSCADAAGGATRNLLLARPTLVEADIDPTPELAAVCAADGWTEPSRRCFTDATSPTEARACARRLTDPQRDHARTVQTEMIERATAVLRTRGGGDASTGMPECDRYLAAIDALIACPQTPQPVRDSLIQARAASGDGWASIEDLEGDTYKTARDSAVLGCRQGAEAIGQAAAGLGC